MKNKHAILTRNQWIGIAILIGVMAIIFIGLHVLPPPATPSIENKDTAQKAIIHQQKQYNDSLYSTRRAYYDSLYTRRRIYYDSLHTVRRDSLHHLYLAHRDSVHQADSLWWDSIRSSTPKSIKKDTVLELNSADTTELKLIRGIGSSMARRIVRYRDQLGGFCRVEQLLDDALYLDQYGHSIRARYSIPDSVLRYFTVDARAIQTIPINHASVERLQSHPYISHTLAKEIYTLRRQRVMLKSIDEISNLPHMNDTILKQITPYMNFSK